MAEISKHSGHYFEHKFQFRLTAYNEFSRQCALSIWSHFSSWVNKISRGVCITCIGNPSSIVLTHYVLRFPLINKMAQLFCLFSMMF